MRTEQFKLRSEEDFFFLSAYLKGNVPLWISQFHLFSKYVVSATIGNKNSKQNKD